ncbi:hypothetical protein K4X31_08745, partial [Streptococcus suis]|uniref:hypothetical protein n=1 Tax=Streptococcus suis TaxID=1307 RepID=UPI001B7D792E
KLAKKLAQKSRNRKKNTGSSAGFHQKQLNLSVFFIYWLVFAQPRLEIRLAKQVTFVEYGKPKTAMYQS